MAYLSLYRRHRPRTFDQVVGQDHVTRTLVNAIREDRLHHAYLFTGQRGTGKTSTARILAAAVNCEQGPTPTPCGECDQCVTIVEGRNVDVVELDMASNGGVDDARDLRDRAVFAPAAARRKVYILDEVHMATNAAFNALLKLVEEPPPHVLFAMATTDPQKVLATIMSRVQRLDLRRVPAPQLTDHLASIGAQDGFRLEDDAAAAVVAAGDGSVRDTLSVLEQVLAYAGDGTQGDEIVVTGEHVEKVLGTTPLELTLAVVDAVADADVAGALGGIQALLEGGHDLRRFTLDLAHHLRDLLVLRAAPDATELVEATPQRRELLAAQAGRFGTDTLLRAVELVGEVLVEQRQGPPRLPLETAVARMASPGADGDLAALADRVARLERGAGPAPAPAARPAAQPAPAAAASPAPAAASPAPDAAADQAAAPAEDVEPAGDDEDAQADTAAAVSADEQVPGDADEDDDSPVGRARARARARATGADPVETVARPEPDLPEEPQPSAEEPTDPADDDDGGAGDTTDTTTRDAADDGSPSEALADATAADEPEPSLVETQDDGSDAPAPRDADAAPASSDDDLAGVATTVPDPTAGREGRPDGEAALAAVVDSWEAILESVGTSSRRAKAFYEPATPASVREGVLVLRYPEEKRFHAEQARTGEMTRHLSAAVERATSLAGLRVDVKFSKEKVRPPKPPPMESAAGAEPEVTATEQVAVEEAEQTVEQPRASDDTELDDLVRSELDAVPVEDDELA